MNTRGTLVLRVLRVLGIFRAFELSDTSTLALFVGSILSLLPVLEVVLGSILLNTACTWSIWGGYTSHTFEYSQHQNCLNRRSILGVWVILGPSPHRVDNFIPFFAENFDRRSLPRVLVGTNYSRGEQLEYFRVPAVFREYMLRLLAVYRDSVVRILYTPSISGFDTADTPVLAVLLLLILPVVAVFRPSVLLILPVLAVFRPSVLLMLPVHPVLNVLDTPKYTRSTKYTWSICEALFVHREALTAVTMSQRFWRSDLALPYCSCTKRSNIILILNSGMGTKMHQ